MPIGAAPQIRKEMRMNLVINLEDILAFFVLLFVTLGATAYLQYLITNVLEYADYINLWFVSPEGQFMGSLRGQRLIAAISGWKGKITIADDRQMLSKQMGL